MNQFQLYVDGEPHGPVQDVYTDAVHDALDEGLATPDELGRIVLHAAAEIRVLTLDPQLN